MKLLHLITFKDSFYRSFFFVIIFTFFTAFSLYSQLDTTKKTIHLSKLKADFITVDSQGNLFIVQDSYLYKYHLNGKLQFSYTNFSLGTISAVDVTNPSKIMVFYKESTSLIFLNEQLSPITGKIDLTAHHINGAVLAAFTTKNSIWIFNYTKMELLELDFLMNNIQKIHYPFLDFQPVQMLSVNDKTLAIQDQISGIMLFDSFGTFIKTIPIISDMILQITDSFIFYIKNDKLFKYNYLKLEESSVSLPYKDIIQVIVYHNTLILLNHKGDVIIY